MKQPTSLNRYKCAHVQCMYMVWQTNIYYYAPDAKIKYQVYSMHVCIQFNSSWI